MYDLLFKLTGVALVATVSAVMLRQHKPELAMGVVMACALVCFALVAVQIGGVFTRLGAFIESAGIERQYWELIIKAVGIAYLTQLAAQVCADAGEGAIAAKVELCGKVIILAMAVPLIIGVGELLIAAVSSAG